MEHLSHPHPLILNDVLHFEEGDHCHGCNERLLCKSSPVYTCSTVSNIDHTSRLSAAENELDNNSCASFFLHKKCAHLPQTRRHQGCDLELKYYAETPFSSLNVSCEMCSTKIRYLFYISFNRDPVEEAYGYSGVFILCLKCAIHNNNNNNNNNSEDDSGSVVDHQTIIEHWSHQHSALRFVDRYATFYCDGCNNVSTDFSYMCVNESCPFWIHQSCADLPKKCTYIHLHKHPLTLASSLPEDYQNFTHFCKICKKLVHPSLWVYYCADCRFFAHVSCVVSTISPQPRDEDVFDDHKLMHLPAADEASMCFMMQKCIKDIISESVDTVMAPPDHINHWPHRDHQLERKNKSDVLAATSDHHHGKYSSQVSSSAESLMICDGCTKPISFSSDDADVFYECNQCKYILHRYCAQFPIEIETAYENFVEPYQRDEFGIDMFSFDMPQMDYNPLDIWCACLPVVIKHRAHHHPLTQYFTSCIIASHPKCAACCLPMRDPVNKTPAGGKVLYWCEICNDFFLHVQCVVKEGTVLHRWDPHPLSLVLSLEDDDIDNHPHGFECEFCSEEIDTNTWFYHCKVCDLSFHLHSCMDFNNHHYSNVKFGAPNIVRID